MLAGIQQPLLSWLDTYLASVARRSMADPTEVPEWACVLEPHRIPPDPELLWNVSLVHDGVFVASMSVSLEETIRSMVSRACRPTCDRRAIISPSIGVHTVTGPPIQSSEEEDDASCLILLQA